MRPGLVGFDLDGTLIDSARGIHASIVVACESLALAPPTLSQLRDQIGPPLKHYLPELLGLPQHGRESLLGELLGQFRTHHDQLGWKDYQLFGGARELLETLESSGWELHLVTLKPRPLAEQILAGCDLAPLFQSLHAPQAPGAPFSKASCLEQLHRKDGASHWYVGDTEADQEAAQRAGYRFAAAAYGYGYCSRADATIHAPLQLLESLG
jgi:phosphoglycolate phosphatase